MAHWRRHVRSSGRRRFVRWGRWAGTSVSGRVAGIFGEVSRAISTGATAARRARARINTWRSSMADRVSSCTLRIRPSRSRRWRPRSRSGR
jgi:hypothetical protein